MIKLLTDKIDDSFLELIIEEVNYRTKIDTYYYALDYNVQGDDDKKVLLVLVGLLERHIETIRTQRWETVWLPLDFRDEYIGYLQVKKEADSLTIEYGFSAEFQGHSVDILNFDAEKLVSFESLSDSFSLSQNQLVCQFDDIINYLRTSTE